jgi:excisionase family DNA binding protein
MSDKDTTMPEDTDRWLSSRSACDYLDVKIDWLYDRIAKGDIPYTKLDRLLRFRKRDLDAYMERHRVL